MTMSQPTQAQLDAMVAAYTSGHASVSYDNRSVTYRNMADLLQAIARVSAALGVPNPLTPAATASSRPGYSLASFRRG
jgi:hypothetical protein